VFRLALAERNWSYQMMYLTLLHIKDDPIVAHCRWME
jgi:hypothetical protein